MLFRLFKQLEAINPITYLRPAFGDGQDIAACAKFFFGFFIFLDIQFRTACQDRQLEESALKNFFQGHNRMTRVAFEPCPYRWDAPSIN